MIERTRAYFRGKAARLPLRSAYLVGSVARGDFHSRSDIGVVVVAEDLPARFLERLELFSDRPPGTEVFPYTKQEFENERKRKNHVVMEADDIGIELLRDAES